MSKSNLIPSLLKSGISAAQKGEFKEAKEIFLKIIDLNDNILSVYLNIINIELTLLVILTSPRGKTIDLLLSIERSSFSSLSKVGEINLL